MNKSLKNFLKKMEDKSFGQINEGFVVFKNIRGGTLITDEGTNKNLCQNDGTCTGTNSNVCSNNRCAEASNTGCTNYGACFA